MFLSNVCFYLVKVYPLVFIKLTFFSYLAYDSLANLVNLLIASFNVLFYFTNLSDYPTFDSKLGLLLS